MYIVSQFYKKMLKDRIISKISSISSNLIDEIIDNLMSLNNDKYFNFINSIQSYSLDIIKSTIVETFEELDLQFKYSKERFSRYIVNKSNVYRTIVTIIGEISFKRTYYLSKLDGSYHFYIDEVFDLPRYDHYDPVVKAIAIEKAFCSNHAQAGRDTGELLFPISKIISDSRNSLHIPRQTVHNWINNWNVPNVTLNLKETPETLYVMADEKYIGCQDLDKDIMVKCMVAFEDIKHISKNRNKLYNRTVYSTYSPYPWDEFTDVLAQQYDFSKIKNIIVLGDGAKWIKAAKDDLKIEPCNKISFRLCIFHFKQAINRITINPDIRDKLFETFSNSSKKAFLNEVKQIIQNDKNNEEKINRNLNYILNNYSSIKAALKSNIGSSMESHISHCIANLFASRPKGYSSKCIKQYLKISNYVNNNLNLLYLYAQSYNNKEIISINETSLDYSMFEKKGSNLPIIDYGMIPGLSGHLKRYIY